MQMCRYACVRRDHPEGAKVPTAYQENMLVGMRPDSKGKEEREQAGNCPHEIPRAREHQARNIPLTCMYVKADLERGGAVSCHPHSELCYNRKLFFL